MVVLFLTGVTQGDGLADDYHWHWKKFGEGEDCK
jgi:hypothetical protein